MEYFHGSYTALSIVSSQLHVLPVHTVKPKNMGFVKKPSLGNIDTETHHRRWFAY